jgi:hypothetical protein
VPEETKRIITMPVGEWWKLDKEELKELVDNTPNGQEIYEQALKLIVNREKFEENKAATLYKEVWQEAKLFVLMKHNSFLNKGQKLSLLRKEGFYPQVDQDRRIYVAFFSNAAPECDSFVYWD